MCIIKVRDQHSASAAVRCRSGRSGNTGGMNAGSPVPAQWQVFYSCRLPKTQGVDPAADAGCIIYKLLFLQTAGSFLPANRFFQCIYYGASRRFAQPGSKFFDRAAGAHVVFANRKRYRFHAGKGMIKHPFFHLGVVMPPQNSRLRKRVANYYFLFDFV